MNITGEIHIIFGCMYSGKSTELLKRVNRYKFLSIPILKFNHSLDIRYGTNKIISHDGNYTECIQTNKLMSYIDDANYNDCKVIIIEEAHFFEDLYEFVIYSCYKKNKCIHIAALNGDFEKKEIGSVLKLIPECNSIIKLSALCSECNDGTPANFTKRISNDKDQFLVGSTDTYKAVCRLHHS